MKKIKAFLLLIMMPLQLLAQDFQFTQFYAAPLYLNPAFAGTADGIRVSANYRSQWTGTTSPYSISNIAADFKIDKYNTGIGIMINSATAGSGGYKRQNASAIYNYHIKMNKKWTLIPSVKFSLGTSSVDPSKLVFGDQIHPDFISNSQDNLQYPASVSYFDFGSGAVLYNKNLWVGFSADHMNRPNISFIQDASILPVNWGVQAGFRIDMNKSRIRSSYKKSKENFICPAFNFKSQGQFRQLDAGLYWHYSPLVFGAWYRGIPFFKSGIAQDAFAILAGIKWNNFQFGYSYDVTLSKLNVSSSGGSHEISLSYVFNKTSNSKKPKQKKNILPCSSF